MPSLPARVHDLWRRILRRLILAWHGRAWVRRWEGRQAREALAQARSVLFLCYGNICRSPFAEHAATRLVDASVRITSAGFHPKVDRPSPQEARRGARIFDVDLDEHRSRLVDAGMLEEADLIFVFDAYNYRDVLEANPRLGGKTHFIGNLDTTGPLEIRDPWGKPQEVFDRTYRSIVDLLEGAVSPPQPTRETR